MNYRHGIVCFVATVAVILVCLFPPYSINSGLIGGTVYVLFSNPPPLDGQTFLDMPLVQCEVAFILVSLCSALYALRLNATRRQRIAFLIGFTLQVLFFAGCIPSINIILMPQLAWYTLDVSAILILFVVQILGYGRMPGR